VYQVGTNKGIIFGSRSYGGIMIGEGKLKKLGEIPASLSLLSLIFIAIP